MIDPTDPDDKGTQIIAWIAWVAVVGALIWAATSCRPQIRDTIVVDKAAIWRCDDHWCVSDGWLHDQEESLDETNDNLRQCLDALESAN